MKAGILLVCFCIIGYAAHAQMLFSKTTNAYNDLQNPIAISNGVIWNQGNNFQLSLPFSFSFSGQTYSDINIRAGGGLNFPGFGLKELFVFHTPFGGYFLKDRGTTSSLSPISYEIAGSPGQRIAKIEWKNAGFIPRHPTINTDPYYINFQVWIYEVDSRIQIHFGSSNTNPATYGYPEATSDSDPGASVKFLYDQCSNTVSLTGPANLPSWMYFSICNPNYSFIDGTPSNGVTYNFFKSITGITETNNIPLNISPNPVLDVLNISGLPNNISIETITITSILGKICYKSDKIIKHEKQIGIPVKGLANGLYLLKIETDKGELITRKILKK